MENVYQTLSKIDVSKHVEKKANLSYLSWAHAWAILLQSYPKSTYTIYENKDGLNYHHDSKTAWVKTGVTVEGIEHIEYLPVMDNRNNSIPIEQITSFDVNKAIQRSITKAISRHGLGLYIYAGEDLPEADNLEREELIAEFIVLAESSKNEKAIATSKDMSKYNNAQIKGFIAKLKT